MTKEILLGLLRHGLTTAGGMLAAKGLIDAGSVSAALTAFDAIAGAVCVLYGVWWSVLQKRAALNGPVVITNLPTDTK